MASDDDKGEVTLVKSKGGFWTLLTSASKKPRNLDKAAENLLQDVDIRLIDRE